MNHQSEEKNTFNLPLNVVSSSAINPPALLPSNLQTFTSTLQSFHIYTFLLMELSTCLPTFSSIVLSIYLTALWQTLKLPAIIVYIKQPLHNMLNIKHHTWYLLWEPEGHGSTMVATKNSPPPILAKLLALFAYFLMQFLWIGWQIWNMCLELWLKFCVCY